MQRLFSMFPQGAPGTALVLLRSSVIVMFFILLINRLSGSPSNVLFPLAGLVISAFIAMGLFTPVASSLACLSAIAILMIDLRSDTLIVVSLILNSAALGLLGPGGYSLDALLFGRRVLVVPARNRASA